MSLETPTMAPPAGPAVELRPPAAGDETASVPPPASAAPPPPPPLPPALVAPAERPLAEPELHELVRPAAPNLDGDRGSNPDRDPRPAPDSDPDALVKDGYLDERRGLRRLPKIPFELFAAVVVGAIVLGVVTVANRNAREGAQEDRRVAEAQVAEIEAAATAMAETNATLAEREGALEERVTELEDAVSTAEQETLDAEAALAAIPEPDTSALDDQISELETSNGDLLDRATTAEADAEALFLAATSPSFAQMIGETLAGGGARALTAAEAQCFGTSVISQVGLDGIGAGMNRDRTTAANNAVVDAMATAASECALSRADVFGR